MFLQGIKKKHKQYSKSHTHTKTHTYSQYTPIRTVSHSLWRRRFGVQAAIAWATLVVVYCQLKQGKTYFITISWNRAEHTPSQFAQTGQNIPHHSWNRAEWYPITVSWNRAEYTPSQLAETERNIYPSQLPIIDDQTTNYSKSKTHPVACPCELDSSICQCCSVSPFSDLDQK